MHKIVNYENKYDDGNIFNFKNFHMIDMKVLIWNTSS